MNELPSVVMTVGELNRLARQVLESRFPLQWITGEVSNLVRAASGHLYFTLKDETAQARCVMFRSRAQIIPWRLENGQQIEARALVSLYEARGEFQLNVEELRQAGVGRLYEAFARLKDKLANEGLFAPERKKTIPRCPSRIGIITSPQAAALRDVLVALRRRAPHVPVVVYPSLVQGEQAAAGIAAAIGVANARYECAVLLLIRGGGSIEDLWSFNDERVARAIVASQLPIIAGVGHETDTTIADFVADLRAATPTAAAEWVSQGWIEVARELAGLDATLHQAMQFRLSNLQQQLDHVSLRLLHPSARLQQSHDRMTLMASRLSAALATHMHRHQTRLSRAATHLGHAMPRLEGHQGELRLLVQRLNGAFMAHHRHYHHRVENLAAALEHLNPHATLARGFAIVRTAQGELVTAASRLHCGDAVTIDLAQGQASAQIIATSLPGIP